MTLNSKLSQQMLLIASLLSNQIQVACSHGIGIAYLHISHCHQHRVQTGTEQRSHFAFFAHAGAADPAGA